MAGAVGSSNFLWSLPWSGRSCIMLKLMIAVVDPWIFGLLKDKLRHIKKNLSLFD